MKQHIYQLILLVLLVAISYLFLRDWSFTKVKTALENSGVSTSLTDLSVNASSSEQVNASTTEEEALLDRREDLFGKLVLTRESATYTPDDPEKLKNAPKYIVAKGYVMNSDAFYSSPLVTQKTNNIEDFLNSTSSASSKKTYSTSTGAITVVEVVNAFKGSKDSVSTGYVSSKNGVAFKVDKDWKISDNEGIIVIKNIGSDGQSRIIMSFSKGNSVVTHDDDNGDLALTYDSAKEVWTNFSSPIDPLYKTNSDQPVFKGTPKIETRVVAFGTKSFVIVNLVGTGKTTVIDRFTKTISEFSGN